MPRFAADRCKVNLRLAINRLKMAQQKKLNAAKLQRKEVASLLEASKEESARIKVEHVIREDYTIEAYEILELFCDLLLARWGLVTTSDDCDEGVREAVETIMWASPRIAEIKELAEVRNQLTLKYGKQFGADAMDNKYEYVNDRVIHKLSVTTPQPALVNQYLVEIAKAHNIDFDPDDGGPAIVNLYAGQPGGGNDLLDLMGGMGGPGGSVPGEPAASFFDQPLPNNDPPLVPMPGYGPPQPSQGGAPQGLTPEQWEQFKQFQAWQAAQGGQAAAQPAAPTPAMPSMPTANTPASVPYGAPAQEPNPPYVPPADPYGAPMEPTSTATNTTPQYSNPPPTSTQPTQPTYYDDDGGDPFDLPSPPDDSKAAQGYQQPPPAASNGSATVDDMPSPGGGGDDDVPDFDELASRFAALKRKK